MKILHVVTLISPDGAYGGPVRVAVNQARELVDLGHDVTIAAGTRGFDVPPTHQDGVPLQLFPVRAILPGSGFAGLSSPAMLSWFLRHARDYDVVHVHLARDLVTMPMARLAQARGLPVFAQTHGMIDPTDKALATPLDAAFTRPILRKAASVFHLTEHEKSDVQAVCGDGIRFAQLANGVPVAEHSAERDAGVPSVLFLARLQQRKRPTDFVDAAIAVLAAGIDARFTLIGPDEGEADAVTRRIQQSEAAASIEWKGALSPDRTLDAMRAADLYVLPSVNEPYPMSVLEAMSVGLPVIVTDTCGLAPMVSSNDCGSVTDGTVESLTAAMTRLLNDPLMLRETGQNAAETVRRTAGMAAVAQTLQAAYSGAVTPSSAP
ncbi:MAG: glycosyltransferase [Rhodococcus sp. (in: high G+C Gram-positive bacteria)]